MVTREGLRVGEPVETSYPFAGLPRSSDKFVATRMVLERRMSKRDVIKWLGCCLECVG